MKLKQTNENIFGAARKFTDAFFDGLKVNATNKAIQAVKNNKKVPVAIVKKMEDIQAQSRELEKMLRDMEND
jgi:hypothetical protein